MEKLKEIVDKIEINSINVNSEHWVDITYIINPHIFYTRLTKNRAAIHKIEKIKPLVKCCSVDVQDIVLINLETDSEKPKYARGKVFHVEQAEGSIKYTLFALDYGFYVKNVPLDQLWECDKLLSDVRPLALRCRLANCGPREDEWEKEEIDAFKVYVGDGHAKMIVTGSSLDCLIVKLYDNGVLDDIASVLVLTGYSGLGYVHRDLNIIQPTTSVEPKIVTYYNFKKIETGDILHVRVLSGKSLDAFYVADVLDYRRYLDERDSFTKVAKKEAPIDETSVKCGDIVCVNDYDDNKFERGIIKEVYNEKATALVHLVDLGKVQVFGFGRLRRLPQQYSTMPVVGIFCSVEDDQACISKPVHILLHPGREILITIKKPGHQFESANIVNIDQIVL